MREMKGDETRPVVITIHLPRCCRAREGMAVFRTEAASKCSIVVAPLKPFFATKVGLTIESAFQLSLSRESGT